MTREMVNERLSRSEPTFTCGKCSAAGEFHQHWQLCEECAREVYYSSHSSLAPAAVEWLLRTLGHDTNREGLRETPRRVAKMLKELSTPEPFDFTVFESEGMDEMIVQAPIPFASLCEHHMLPFVGTAAVAYIPNGKIVGLSKLARAVKHCSAGLQNQERITTAIADMLQHHLQPVGIGVQLRARHLCMEVRGVRVPDVYTTTECLRGALKEDARAREEFLQLARDGR